MKKLYELKNERQKLLDNVQAALDKKDMTAYDAGMKEIADMNGQITALEALEGEKARFGAENLTPAEPAAPPTEKPGNSGNEYIRAFAAAIRGGYSPKTGVGVEQLRPLYNALTIGGGNPEGADGGFLVPVEFNDMINEERRQLIALSQFFSAENVNTPTGWRAIDTTPSKGFALVDEMGAIPQDDQPKFRKVTYSVKKYAGIVPVSAELIADNTANLMAYLSRWIARKSVLQENLLLKAVLDTLTATSLTAGKELPDLKKALNKLLDPDIAANAVIITNQTGFDYLDQLTAVDGRPVLQPDPTSGTPMLFKSKRVVVMSDATLANKPSGVAPIHVGDFRQFATIFRRQPLEVASTNIGGSAWATDSVEVRAIMRLDVVKMDDKAAVRLNISEPPAAPAQG